MNSLTYALHSRKNLYLAVVLTAFSASSVFASPIKLRPITQEFPANVAQSKVVGAPADNEIINITVSLAPRDAAGLEAFCNSVSDPKSPNYMHWLVPSEVGELFGADKSTVDATVDYLKSCGLTVTLAAPNRMAVLATGTISQVKKAFNIKLATFQAPLPEGGGTYTYRAFLNTPQVPVGISRSVINIEGIDTSSRPRHSVTQLTPALHRGLYGLAPIYGAGYTGLGRTVGVTNWGDGYKLTNVPLFYTHFGLPTPGGGLGSNVHVVAFSGGSAAHSAAGETDLDIQLELGPAPLAECYLYDDGGNGANHVGMLTTEGTNNFCDTISESWGWSNITGTTATSLHNQYLAMQAQGITYMCASGDSGTKDVYDYPDFDPAVLVVGGTTANVDGTTGARITEVGWSGSGGGYSNKSVSFNVLPAWQVGTGVPTAINARLFPDISGHAASGSGAYQFYYNGALSAANGTSLSSPSMAGSIAITEQRLIAAGLLPPNGAGKRRFGHMQELIYSQNGRPDVYYDVTSGSNGLLYNGSSSVCTTKWDTVAGWGCFNYNGLCNALITINQTVVPQDLTLFLGSVSSGGYTDLASVDGSGVVICKLFVPSASSPFVRFTVSGTTTLSNLTAYSFSSTAKMNTGGTFLHTIEAYNFSTSTYDVLNSAAINTSYSTLTVTVPSSFNNYVSASTVQARVNIKVNGFTATATPCATFDAASWALTGN